MRLPKFSKTLALAVCCAAIAAADDVRPVVDLHVHCLLGGFSGGKWMTEDEAAAKIAGGEQYRILRAKGLEGQATGGKASGEAGACEGTKDVALTPAPDKLTPGIAVSGTWNPQPRAAHDLMAAKRRYATLLQPSLSAKGVRTPAEVRQLYRADLEGDGKDEVIAVVANFSYADTEAKMPSRPYSGVALRRVKGTGVETLLLEFDNKQREGGVSEFSGVLLADVNGDGSLEVVIHGRYLQGKFTTVYSLQGGKLRKVLSCSCGG